MKTIIAVGIILIIAIIIILIVTCGIVDSCMINHTITHMDKYDSLLPVLDDDMPDNIFAWTFREALHNAGYTIACGMVGGPLTLLYKYKETDHRFISFMTRDERTAGFIANGTCRPGVSGPKAFAFGTTGPGSTNLATPMGEAFMENIPSLYIVADIGASDGVTVTNINNRWIQDIEPENLFAGLAKKIYRLERSKINDGTVLQEMYEAMNESRSYPAGPLVLVVTSGSLDTPYDYNHEQTQIFNRLRDPVQQVFPIDRSLTTTTIDHLASTLKRSSKPLVLIGAGCHDHMHTIMSHLKRIRLPYIVSLPVAGFADDNDPLCARIMGHMGTYTGNMTSLNTDWVCGIGTSFDFYQVVNDETVFPNARGNIYSINRTPESYKIDFLSGYIRGDVSLFTDLAMMIEEPLNTSEWISEINNYRIHDDKKIMDHYFNNRKYHTYGSIAQQLQHFIDSNSHKKIYICTDVGVNQCVIPQLLKFRPHTHLISPYKFASMGSSFGNAIGISIADPDAIVIVTSGDGGFLLNQNDLITIHEIDMLYGLCKNMFTIVFDNSGLGLISQEVTSKGLPDFKYANSYITTVNWKYLMKASHLACNLITHRRQKIIFKSKLINVIMLEHDIHYAPFVSTLISLDKMQYNAGGMYDKYTAHRIREQLYH